MSNIYFHIGYPKSASTTLQKQLFNKHSEIINLGLYPTKNVGQDSELSNDNSFYLSDKDIKRFYDNLLKKDEINYRLTDNEKLFSTLLQRYGNSSNTLVFSEERTTSVFFTHPDIGLKANRIKQLIPNAKIIIVIRNQIDALKSMYADFPFDPRSFSMGRPIDIDRWINIVLNDEFIHYRDMLNYFNVIEYYSSLFGSENICILRFEDLVNNIEYFSNTLSNFMHINSAETLKLLSEKHENQRVAHRFNIARSIRNKYFSNLRIRSILGDKTSNVLINFLKQGTSKRYTLQNGTMEKVYLYYEMYNNLLHDKYRISTINYNQHRKQK